MQVRQLEGLEKGGPHPEKDDLALLAVDSTLDRDEKADLRAGQVGHLAQVDGEPGILARLDQLVQPVALQGFAGSQGFTGSDLSNYPKTGCNPRKIQDLRAFSDSYLGLRRGRPDPIGPIAARL